MADTFITGTSGNDTIQAPPGGASAGSIVLVVAGSVAQGIPPIFNVLVNGVVVMANVAATADHLAGATQQVVVPLAAGTPVTSVAIDYINDPQTDFTQDRNLFVSSVTLDGTPLALASGSYFRNFFTPPLDVIPGQADMKWGGTMTFSGAVVQNAVAGAGGSVFIDGGAGIDTVNFSGLRSAFTITHTATDFTVTGAIQAAHLTNVERVHFDDINVAIDMSGNAGTDAKLIAALFGKSFLDTEQFVGVGLRLLDGGMSETNLAALAVNTSQFAAVAGSFSNTDFVRLVYHNVVGVDPGAQALANFVAQLDSGAATKADLAVLAAEHPLNQVNLVGVANGIEFV
jgi:hypothetical protein